MVTFATGILEPALLLTCKLIRKEAIGLLYAGNLFKADAPNSGPRNFLLMRRKLMSLIAGCGCKTMCVVVNVRHPRHLRNLLGRLRYYHRWILHKP
jgi:hypothetical protein